MAKCVVSFLDHEGIRHSVKVDADGLYEAAALAIRTFRHHECEPSQASNLEIEVRSSVVHTISVGKINTWLNGTPKSPKEKIAKDRLRAMVAGD